MRTISTILRQFLGGLTAVALLAIVLPSTAQIVLSGTDANRFEFTENTQTTLGVRSTLHQINQMNVSTTAGLFTELGITDYSYSNIEGAPKVPVMRRLIEFPLGSTFEIKVVRENHRDYTLSELGIQHPIIPAQPPVSKQYEDASVLPFVYNQEIYAKDAFLFDEMAHVIPSGIMRGQNLGVLEIYPIQYNPVRGILRIYDVLEVTVVFKGGDLQATEMLKKRTASPFFSNTYRMAFNYKAFAPKDLITDAPITYVIVSDPMFEATLQPFIQWKTKRGFKVIEAYTNDAAVGTTTTSIKNYLQGIYNNPPAGYNVPSFVLFVGDVAQIPAFSGTAGSHPTDLYYCEYTGDKLPELFYGRFSATTVAQLQPQIDKTLQYEQYTFPSDEFLGRALGVAGADASHQLTYGNGQVNYGTTYYFNTAHGLNTLALLQPEPSGANYHQQVINKVSEGLSIGNYSAHCGESGWSDPSFSISDIPSLTNNNMYGLLIGNCCLSNKFDVTCFGEEILRAANKGAVGYIGGSNSTYWDEDFWWACGQKAVSTNPVYDPNHLGSFDRQFHDHGETTDEWYITQGQMVVGGNLAVEESSSSMKTYYWEIYHLMGDPSLTIYAGVPQAVTASYQNAMLVGMTNLAVNTEEHAYVALSMNGTLLAAGVAPANGVVNLTFTALNNVGAADIVIMKQNRKPHIGQITVAPATGPYLIVQGYTVNDVNGNNNGQADFGEEVYLNVTFKNVGVQTASNVNADLHSTDGYMTLIDSLEFIAAVEPGATLTIDNAYKVLVGQLVPDQHPAPFNFAMSDGTNIWEASGSIMLNAPVLEIVGVEVNDATTGNGNGVLDPGETAILNVITKNSGHADALNAPAHLTVMNGSTPYIIVQTPNYTFSNLAAGQSASASFNVVTNIITPPLTNTELQYTVTAGNGAQYNCSEVLNVTVGATPQVLMTEGTFSVCNTDFFDTGGPDGPYGLNENIVMTLTPSTPGALLKVTFNAFDVESNTGCSWDYLNIYNGTTTSAPLIGTYCGTTTPPSFTATNTSGAITFKFHSDGMVAKAGWKAYVECLGGNLTATVAAFPPDVCSGNTSQLGTLTMGGTGSYTYEWSPAEYLDNPSSPTPIATAPSTTEFSVNIYDGSNNVTGTTTVTIHEYPVAPVVTIEGNALVSSYALGNQWFNDNGMIPGATAQSYVPSEEGNYYATVTSEFNCESESSNVVHYKPVGIGDPETSDDMMVYPNPFNNQLNMSYTLTKQSPVQITVWNHLGQLVATVANETMQSAGRHDIVFNGSSIEPGIYFIRFNTGSNSAVYRVVMTK
ncbi:MAG: hypothetical protein A2X11_05055 [Bacteroidetes bacterium GWE2_42_24]|nr:MAG: hypothetical protein A2X11_05055 [Bacteroidetes bacterium GWE2_42_24]